MIADVLQRLPDAALDARIAAAFAEDTKSVDVSRLLPEVEAAANSADAAAGRRGRGRWTRCSPAMR